MGDSKGKWKDYLLRSSLPLERVVTEKLERHSFYISVYISGEYIYTRPNESNVNTDFSADLHASDFLEYKDNDLHLSVLVECKYNYPGVKWIFSPYPEQSHVVMGFVNYLEELCTKRLENKEPLFKLDRDLEYCTKGIELHDKGVDPNGISRGLHQLRYALPNLVAQECRAQINAWHEEDLVISCVCPILVTTASFYTLNPGLDLEAFQSANSLDDLVEEVEALVVYQEPGPQLRRYCSQVSLTLHKQYPEVAERLKEFENILGTHKGVLPSTWTFDDHIVFSTNNILVVRLDALDRILTLLRKAAMKALKSTKRVATLSVDLEKRTKRILPFAEA